MTPIRSGDGDRAGRPDDGIAIASPTSTTGTARAPRGPAPWPHARLARLRTGIDAGGVGHQPISSPRHVFHVPRLRRRVAQGRPHLPDAEMQARVEIHMRVRPQPLADFLPADNRSLTLHEKNKQTRRLRREALRRARAVQPPQLAAAGVELEWPELILLCHTIPFWASRPFLCRVCTRPSAARDHHQPNLCVSSVRFALFCVDRAVELAEAKASFTFDKGAAHVHRPVSPDCDSPPGCRGLFRSAHVPPPCHRRRRSRRGPLPLADDLVQRFVQAAHSRSRRSPASFSTRNRD